MDAYVIALIVKNDNIDKLRIYDNTPGAPVKVIDAEYDKVLRLVKCGKLKLYGIAVSEKERLVYLDGRLSDSIPIVDCSNKKCKVCNIIKSGNCGK